MRQRAPQFEVIPLSEIPALAATRKTTSPRPQVLSISYDESLARTRELILDAAGIEVHTALDIQKAMWLFETNRYDLIILGHSIPLNQRRLIAQRLRALSSTPILAISRAGEKSPVQAEYHVDAGQGPRRLLNVVRNILKIAEPSTAAFNESESGDEVLDVRNLPA
jgi:DNA-binding response OmpR family regulator